MIFNAICSSAGSHHFKDILQSMTKNYKHTKTGKVYKDGFVIYKSKLKWITLEEIYVFNELCSNIETEEKFYKNSGIKEMIIITNVHLKRFERSFKMD